MAGILDLLEDYFSNDHSFLHTFQMTYPGLCVHHPGHIRTRLPRNGWHSAAPAAPFSMHAIWSQVAVREECGLQLLCKQLSLILGEAVT